MKLSNIIIPFLFFSTASAKIIDTSVEEKKAYLAVSPVVEISTLDIGESGGFMTIFANYENADFEDVATVERQYPEFYIQAISLEHTADEVEFSIPQINLQTTLPIRRGQLGPYLNSQIMISKGQLRLLKKIKNLDESVILKIPVRADYIKTELLEEFKATKEYCANLKVKTLKDLTLTLSSLRPPQRFKYPETMNSLKSEILENCFEFPPQHVTSMKDLVSIGLKENPKAVLTAKATTQKNKSQSFILPVKLKFRFD